MQKVYHGLEEMIGHTPMVELKCMEEKNDLKACVFAKMEWFNPGGSAKDRIAVKMIDEAEKAGIIAPGKSTIIEPTSGNTGIGLATVGVLRGYRVIIVMPESMSEERKMLMKAHGAELVLTEAAKGMAGAIAKAEELAETITLEKEPLVKEEQPEEQPEECGPVDAWIPQQFKNPVGPLAHYEATGPGIWNDMNGDVAAFIGGVGTGGTLSGVGRYLKEKNPQIKIIAVEPKESAVLSGDPAGKHGIQGIGAGFIPEVLDTDVYDEIITVSTDEAYGMCRRMAKIEGFLIGISSGAAMCAAVEVAGRPEMEGQNIVVLLPDSGERYMSVGLFE